MKTIAVYGTLKKGHYNYERFNMGTEAKFLGKSTIVGSMDLFAGSYPRLYPEGTYPEFDREHVIEVYEVPEEMFKSLDNMERGAGYQSHDISCDIDGAKVLANVWLMNPAYEIDLEQYIKSFPVNSVV